MKSPRSPVALVLPVVSQINFTNAQSIHPAFVIPPTRCAQQNQGILVSSFSPTIAVLRRSECCSDPRQTADPTNIQQVFCDSHTFNFELMEI